MTSRERPLVDIEDVGPAPRSGTAPDGPLVVVETLDTADLSRLEPSPSEVVQASPGEAARGGGWLAWSLLGGVAGLALVGVVDWVLDLLARIPILGAPATLAAVALGMGLVGLAWREARALRVLREVDEVRARWQGADGDRLRRLILRIGADLGETATARRAADVVEAAGPAAARRIMSNEVMAPRDERAARAVATASRQGFVMVTASPSPALDALLLMARAVRLLREIAGIYGYRPGALAMRSLAMAVGRDAGAVAVADAFAEAAAQSASTSLAKAGDGLAVAGVAAGSTGAGLIVGLPLTVAGLGLSLFGRTLGATGGAVGGGAAAAWRLYRFGLMVLVAARPLPFDDEELSALRQRARAEVLRMTAKSKADGQGA